MSAAVRRDLLIVACAVSAGIPAGLAPEHLDESAATGGGFIAATILLAALVIALRIRSDSRVVAIATALTFVGLLVSYALAVTTGMPILQPDPEPVDGLALATKAVEGLGLAIALGLSRRGGGVPAAAFSYLQTEGARR
jgi:hypothetical protein